MSSVFHAAGAPIALHGRLARRSVMSSSHEQRRARPGQVAQRPRWGRAETSKRPASERGGQRRRARARAAPASAGGVADARRPRRAGAGSSRPPRRSAAPVRSAGQGVDPALDVVVARPRALGQVGRPGEPVGLVVDDEDRPVGLAGPGRRCSRRRAASPTSSAKLASRLTPVGRGQAGAERAARERRRPGRRSPPPLRGRARDAAGPRPDGGRRRRPRPGEVETLEQGVDDPPRAAASERSGRRRRARRRGPRGVDAGAGRRSQDRAPGGR